MSAHYFEVPLRTVFDDYIRRRFSPMKDCPVQRLPMTGQPIYDEWIDCNKGTVMFRIFDAKHQSKQE